MHQAFIRPQKKDHPGLLLEAPVEACASPQGARRIAARQRLGQILVSRARPDGGRAKPGAPPLPCLRAVPGLRRGSYP